MLKIEVMEQYNKQRLLTVQETKTYLNIGINAVYKLCKIPGFPVVKIGSKKFIDLYKLNRWLDNLTEGEFDVQLVENMCPYYCEGDLWMCQFCNDKCSRAGKVFEEYE